jgi:hypothetical protein
MLLSPSQWNWPAPGVPTVEAQRAEREPERLVHVSTPFGRIALGVSENPELRPHFETALKAAAAAYGAATLSAESALPESTRSLP